MAILAGENNNQQKAKRTVTSTSMKSKPPSGPPSESEEYAPAVCSHAGANFLHACCLLPVGGLVKGLGVGWTVGGGLSHSIPSQGRGGRTHRAPRGVVSQDQRAVPSGGHEALQLLQRLHRLYVGWSVGWLVGWLGGWIGGRDDYDKCIHTYACGWAVAGGLLDG